MRGAHLDDDASASDGVREWLNTLPESAGPPPSFDTRLPNLLAGGAARPVARGSQRCGREDMSRPSLVLDEVLPRYDVSLVHARVFRAPPEECLATLVALDVFRHPIIRLLITARGLPVWILGGLTGKRRQPSTAGSFTLSQMAEMGWVVLGDRPGAELVLGQVSRPCRLRENAPVTPRAHEEFRQFTTPGYAKIAASFRADPYGAGSAVLTVESRILLTDEAGRRRFMRYWVLVRLGSEIIRRLALRMLARELSARPDVQGTIEIAAPIDRVSTPLPTSATSPSSTHAWRGSTRSPRARWE
jgi:hypothetical protein